MVSWCQWFHGVIGFVVSMVFKKRKGPLFSKNAFKIFSIQVYKFSFLITLNIYRFNGN